MDLSLLRDLLLLQPGIELSSEHGRSCLYEIVRNETPQYREVTIRQVWITDESRGRCVDCGKLLSPDERCSDCRDSESVPGPREEGLRCLYPGCGWRVRDGLLVTLKLHIRRIHGRPALISYLETEESAIQGSGERPRYLRCALCRSQVREEYLINHAVSDHPDALICERCGAAFLPDAGDELVQHQKNGCRSASSVCVYCLGPCQNPLLCQRRKRAEEQVKRGAAPSAAGR